MATLISSEFFINDETNDVIASRPDVGVDAQGNFVVVWEQINFNTFANDGLLVRRFDNTGDPEGDAIVVDPVSSFADPAIAVAADGRFVVVWEDFSINNDISAQIYEADGDLDVSTFAVEDDNSFFNRDPDVAINASTGNFVVTWVQDDDDGDRNLVAQLFTNDGDTNGDVIIVETIDDNDVDDGQFLANPAVAMDNSGDFVIVWEQDTQEDDDNGTDIFAKRYSASGAVLDSTFLVNTQQEGSQIDPDVAVDSSGDFTIAWDSPFVSRIGTDIDEGIYARQYGDNGTPTGDQFAVVTFELGDGSVAEPAVAMDSSGDTLIVWQNFDADDSDDASDIFAQAYDAAGNPVGTAFRVNDDIDIEEDQLQPAVASSPSGDAVVVWESNIISTVASDQNVLGQRVSLGNGSTTTPPDDNDNDNDNSGDNNNTGGNTVPDVTLTGTNQDDFLEGSSENELIQGLAGNDNIFGKLGDDELEGDNGRDRIQGGGGSDTISGGNNADELFGNGGSDTIFGGSGRDSIFSGGGADISYGGDGRDTLLGNGGNDFLSGGSESDRLIGGGGSDSLFGGSGDDLLRGGGGETNFFDGGEGRDKMVGRRGSVDTFAIIPGNGLDEIRNFTFREDFLAFENIRTAFESTEYIRNRRGTLVKVNGERVAIIRGVDLSINVLFSEISVELTREQRLGIPSNI